MRIWKRLKYATATYFIKLKNLKDVGRVRKLMGEVILGASSKHIRQASEFLGFGNLFKENQINHKFFIKISFILPFLINTLVILMIIRKHSAENG